MTDKKAKTRGLGRGLSALMADVAPEAQSTGDAAMDTPRRPEATVPIEKIFPNPEQPRRHFSPEHLEELANSIREKGVIQPLIVRPRPGRSEEYEIVAGERRWRAAQMAKQHSLPVVVREFDDTEVLEVAIIENIQRADLNPVEEAVGFRQLMDRFGHTQEKLAEALGKSRSHIANLLRLLQLPEEVQGYLRDGRLSAGHARALVTADDPITLAKKVIRDGLSVRATEKLAKSGNDDNIFAGDKSSRKSSRGGGAKDADTKALEGDLSAAIGMKVSVDHAAGKESGQVTIAYATLDDLDEICRILSAGR